VLSGGGLVGLRRGAVRLRRRGNLRTDRLLATVLATLAGDARIEVALVLVKGVRAVVHAWLRWTPLILARYIPLHAHVIVVGGIGRIGPVWLCVIWRSSTVLLPVIRRAVVATIVVIVVAAILIETRVVTVDVAVDDFVVRSPGIFNWRAAGSARVTRPIVAWSIVPGPVVCGPVVARSVVTALPVPTWASPVGAHIVVLDVVVVHVPVDRVVAIDVVDVHRAIDDCAVDGDVGIAVVDVDVASDIDAIAGAAYPAAVPATSAPSFTAPASVVDPAPAAAISPTKIEVEPGADGKADAKGDRGAVIRAAIINDRGIIDGDINVLRLVRGNGDVVAVLENFLLG